MKKTILILLMAGLILAIGTAQEEDPVLAAFRKNFTRGSLTTKIQILQDAAEQDPARMGPLYLQAIDFILGNMNQLRTDNLARELGVLALRLIGFSDYAEAAHPVWQLFEEDERTSVRIEALSTLGIIVDGNERIGVQLIDWLERQNTAFTNGERVNQQVVGEAVVTLGKLGFPDSFPVLFTAMVLKYSDDITAKASEALTQIEGDYTAMIIEVIRQSPLNEKLAALKVGLAGDTLTDEQKGEIAETALQLGIYTSASSQHEQELIRQIRYAAVRGLTELQWPKATPNVIEHFDITLMEYDRGIIVQSNLLEAIACLGAMGTHEAAVRLTLYLELLNAYVENGQNVETQVVLAVISNLGELGDPVAFDHLLYTGYLDYPGTVKKASREALNKLTR
jgi:hypothetical protein